MSDWSALIEANQKRWDAAQYSPHAKALAHEVAQRLDAEKAKNVYRALEGLTNVPWYAIAMIHEREASQSWKANIAQGDPWNRKSVHVPANRGPFKSFMEAAVDALVHCPPYASQWKDWSMGGLLTLLELYNGVGYEKYHHMASPYLWAGSDQYRRGKYVADGHFDPSVVDPQLGCAVLLRAMADLDPSITLERVTEPVTEADQNGPPEVDDELYKPVSEPVPEPENTPEITGFEPKKDQIPDWLRNQAQDEQNQQVAKKAAKSLWKSRIGWGTVGLGASSTATAAANTPGSVLDSLAQVAKTPMFWLILVNVVLVAFVLYRYWKDHGKGSA